MLLENKNYKNTFFCTNTGNFYRKSYEGSDLYILETDESNRHFVYSYVNKKYTNKNAANLAWEFIHNTEIPKGYAIYFKDLNKENLLPSNLGIISTEDRKLLRDAIRNINGELKITPNPTEVYTYRVKYRSGGMAVSYCFDDAIAAKDYYKKIEEQSTRFISKYESTV